MSSLTALLALGPLLLLVGLVVYIALLREARGESQTGADAAALAAARELATDDLLTSDTERAKARLDRARVAAHTLARSNLSAGEQLNLDPNEANADDGDIVFGHRRLPDGSDSTTHGVAKVFVPAGADPANWTGAKVTAVRVMVGRSPMRGPLGGSASDRKVLARATAELDFSVVGFRPTNDDPLPLVPVALFPVPKPAKSGAEADEWSFDPVAKKFVSGKGDGIPEFRVIFGGKGDDTAAPGAFLRIGTDRFEVTIAQITSGLGRPALGHNFGGDFVLGPDNILKVVGSPGCPPAGSESRRRVCAAFAAASDAGQPRVWPLASGFAPDGESVRVNGFTAARVVAVRHEGAGIELVLQPAVYSSPAVATEPRTPAPAFWATNRTICRVRLAD